MIWAKCLQRAALILAISLFRECCLHAAPLGEDKPQDYQAKPQHMEGPKGQERELNLETPLSSQSQQEIDVQARSLSDYQSKASISNDEDELFKDVDPKTLAAVLLQALNIDQDKPQDPSDKQDNAFTQYEKTFAVKDEPKPNEDTLTEKVQSRTRSSSIEPPKQMTTKQSNKDWREEEEKAEDQDINFEDMDNIKSMLQELEKYSAAAKRERSNNVIDTYNDWGKDRDSDNNPNILKELEDFKVIMDEQGTETKTNKEMRRSFSKHRVEEKKYVKQYKDLAEARRQAEKQAQDDKIADIASNLLLQYLLKGEDNTDQENNGKEEAEISADETKKSNLIFDDDDGGNNFGNDIFEDGLGEQDTAAEDKRSNEQDEDMDPQTIDKLIEISSKLHLPADDVIDIINDVEKKKKDLPERAEPKHKQSHRERVRTPSARYDAPQPIYYPPYHKKEKSKHRMKEQEVWNNNMLGNDLDYDNVPMAMPRKYRAKQNTYSNYIEPRTFQKPRQYYYNPPNSLMQREDYYDESQDREEELENYIEKILLKHPEVFQ